MYLTKLKISDFISKADHIWKDLQTNFRVVHKCPPSESEVTSWRESLPQLAEVLSELSPSVKESYIYLEYGMPSSFCRADAVIVGLDDQGHRSAIVVELKQWDINSVQVEGYNLKARGSITTHPSDQALGYRDYLVDLSIAFADVDNTVKSCSFLHNALSHTLKHVKAG